MPRILTSLLVLVVAVLAVTLFLRGSEVMYAIQSVNSTYATLNLTDVRPTINVTCYDVPSQSTAWISPVGGDTREVVCNGTADDTNGNTELTSVSGYLSNVPPTTLCVASPRNCSINNSCALLSSPNSTAKYFECRFWLWFNAANTTKSGTWGANMTVLSNGARANATDFINVSELLAIGVPSILQFGGHTIGANDSLVGGCAQCDHTVWNYGNIRMDILVNASDFVASGASSCSGLKNDHLHVNLTDNSPYEQSYMLSDVATDSQVHMAPFNLGPDNTGTTPPTPSTGYTYWGIGVPAGASGSCQSTIWFTAVSG